MQFGLEIQTERSVILRFETFGQDLHARLLQTMQSLQQRLLAAVLADEPTQTGALKSITGGRTYENENSIVAVAGVKALDGPSARKAAALEFGNTGAAFVVRAHHATLWHIWSRAIAPITVDIPEHTRVGTITPRRFLRNAIDALREQAIAEMRQAVSDAVSEAE